MKPKPLLIVTAAIETAAALALLVSPSGPVTILLGSTLDAPSGLVAARVAGAALLSLGLACWLARRDGQSVAVRGLIAAMLLYNVGVAAVLLHAGQRLEQSGVGLWPAVVLHLTLAAWCVACLRPVNPSVNYVTRL